MFKPRTLKGRLTAWYAGVLAIVLLAFSGAAYFSFLAEEDEEQEATSGAGAPEGNDAETERVGHRLLIGLAVGLLAGLAVATAGGFWIARRALRPLDRIEAITKRLRGDDLSPRIEIDAREPEDITRLALAVNDMLDHIEQSVQGLRRFTADASHELRTPIASMIATLEVSLIRPRDGLESLGAMHSVLEDLRRVANLIEALLTLARVDAGELPINPAGFALVDLVRQTVESYEPVASDRRITLQLAETGSPSSLTCDGLWVGRIVANLVDNACKFTPDGGAVEISVAGSADAVSLLIKNTGPPLPPESHGRIFDRFFRAPSARGSTVGSGLGLALSRDIARRLGGDLRLVESTAAGTSFALELPRDLAGRAGASRKS